MDEVWKPVASYEDLYMVSNCGRIKRIWRWGESVNYLLKPGTTNKGYKRVILCKEGVIQSKEVHILVAETFIPNPLGLPLVAHDDDVKDNNTVANLKWSDQIGNWVDRKRNGNDIGGEQHPQAKLTWEIVREIRKLKMGGKTIDELVSMFKVSSSCIQNVIYRKTWRK